MFYLYFIHNFYFSIHKWWCRERIFFAVNSAFSQLARCHCPQVAKRCHVSPCTGSDVKTGRRSIVGSNLDVLPSPAVSTLSVISPCGTADLWDGEKLVSLPFFVIMYSLLVSKDNQNVFVWKIECNLIY